MVGNITQHSAEMPPEMQQMTDSLSQMMKSATEMSQQMQQSKVGK